MTLPNRSFAENIFEQVEQGRKGSGGIYDENIVFQGLRYYAIELKIRLRLPSGKEICKHFSRGEEKTGLCILFKRVSDREDHLPFVVLNEQEEIIASSEEGAVGYFFAAFAREGGKQVFSLAAIATQDGEKRYSDLLLSDNQRTTQFLYKVEGLLI